MRSQRADDQHYVCDMLIIPVAAPQPEQLHPERTDEQGDGKMNDHGMHPPQPAHKPFAESLVLVGGLLVHAAHVHVVAGDVAAAHVHVHGRHRAHAHVAVASVRPICFLRLGCAASGRPGTERIVIFVRRCRRAY
jgi:hypothetical protein